jgi:hypothetical protein
MRPQDWDTLLWSLRKGNCILLLGPEVQTAGESASPAAIRCALAKSLTADLDDGAPPDVDLTNASRRYQRRYSTADLHRAVEVFYEEHDTDECSVLATLAALPFYCVISSCHDHMLRNAFRAAGKSPRVEHYNFRGRQPVNIEMGTAAAPLIYHLQGLPAVPESLVLGEHELLDFLVAIVTKNPQLPEGLRAELMKTDKSLLFVGFGVKYWHLRVLLHVLRASHPDIRSFAIEAFENKAAEQSAVLFYASRKIEVFDAAVPEFLTELRQRYEKNVKTVPPTPAEDTTLAQRPSVFLCHASEDKPLVQKVSDALRRAGCDTWLDQEKKPDDSGLRGGDEWDLAIQKQMSTSDFCVVFVTPNLTSKVARYVFREIKFAKDRQSYFREGIPFIIPVLTESCEIPSELSQIQAEQLGNPESPDTLISLIRRNFQRRAARQ